MRRSLSILFWFLFFFLLTAFVGGVGAFEHWRHEPVTATLESDVLAGPRDALVVDFLRAVQAKSFEGSVTLTPAIPFGMEWHDFGKRLVITPAENWPLDTRYQLVIGQGKTNFFTRTPIFSFSFAGPKLPALVSVTPADQSKDVILGVEDPIRVTFDRTVKDFYVDFQFDPPVAVVYQNNPEKTAFEILPSGELQPGQSYRLSIRTRWRNDADTSYRPLGVVTFTTLPPKPVKANTDFATRIEEAKRFTRAKERLGKYIDVNLGNQVMTLFEDGRAVDAYIISSGKRGMDTPKGTFAIENKAARPWSKAYSLYMPYWQAITPDGKYGIHELPEWPGGYKEGANHLGTPVSHGCMRLGVGPAKRVYEWAPIGTPVMIY
ncbi:MAG: L,D-transpeptidase family protein [Candidatus Moraniibacteriota bacterium]